MAEGSLYRHSTVGLALQEALTEMHGSGELPLDAAHAVLDVFDEVLPSVLSDCIPARMHARATARINYYNAFMDVWQLDVLRMQADDDEAALPESQRAKILCSKT